VHGALVRRDDHGAVLGLAQVPDHGVPLGAQLGVRGARDLAQLVLREPLPLPREQGASGRRGSAGPEHRQLLREPEIEDQAHGQRTQGP
jgi:hypothetical protein